MNLIRFIKKHPVPIYFTLAYAGAWGGILLLIGPGGLEPAETRPMQVALLVFVAMLLGPSLSGITLTAVLDGTPGLRELLSRWLRWRIHLRWYAVALLTTPVLLLVIGLLLPLVSPVIAGRNTLLALIASSDKATVLSFGLTVGLLAGYFEEIGLSYNFVFVFNAPATVAKAANNFWSIIWTPRRVAPLKSSGLKPDGAEGLRAGRGAV